jgi:hypothetical protein
MGQKNLQSLQNFELSSGQTSVYSSGRFIPKEIRIFSHAFSSQNKQGIGWINLAQDGSWERSDKSMSSVWVGINGLAELPSAFQETGTTLYVDFTTREPLLPILRAVSVSVWSAAVSVSVWSAAVSVSVWSAAGSVSVWSAAVRYEEHTSELN